MEDRGHGAAVARRGAGALSAMPRCYASIPCGSEAILPHDVARGYFRRGDEGVEVPGSAYPQRAGPPGRSVTSATNSVRNSAFPVGASPLLCSALLRSHYRMAEQSGGSMAYPRWVSSVADRPRSLGERLVESARPPCSGYPVFAAASVGFGPPPAPLGRRPSWPRRRSHAWMPFSGRVGGALFRGWRCDASRRLRRPGIGALLWPCGPGARARAASTGGCARLPTLPSADSPLMRIRWEDRTVGESAPSGWRGERVEETGCKKKRCCHKSPLSWP